MLSFSLSTIPSIISCIRQLFHAVMFLRSHHVIHGDIKPENIFVKSAATFVLADFGGAILESEAAPNLHNVLQTSYSDDYVNGNDLLQMVEAVKNRDLKTWKDVSYARDFAATALSCLQMIAREAIHPKEATHREALKALYDGCEEVSGKAIVKIFPWLLDLSQISPVTIESMFNRAGIHNTLLIQLFQRCLSNSYELRPKAEDALKCFDAIAPRVLLESKV